MKGKQPTVQRTIASLFTLVTDADLAFLLAVLWISALLYCSPVFCPRIYVLSAAVNVEQGAYLLLWSPVSCISSGCNSAATKGIAIWPWWLRLQLPNNPTVWPPPRLMLIGNRQSVHVPYTISNWGIYCLLYCDNNVLLCQLCPVRHATTPQHQESFSTTASLWTWSVCVF